jgi:hypothetical protein
MMICYKNSDKPELTVEHFVEDSLPEPLVVVAAVLTEIRT